MPDTENSSQRQRRKKKGSSPQSPLIIIIVLLLIIVAGAGIFFLNGTQKTDDLKQDPGLSQVFPDQGVPDQTFSEPAPVHPEEPDQLAEKAELQEGQQIEEPGVPGPAVTDELDNQIEKKEKECELLGNKLYNFFIHIDSEEYMKHFALQEPAQTYFIRLAYNLLDNPPVVSRESDDLYTILKNMAHFFRIIGKDNILLIKAILDRERDKIEDVASELYQWMTIGSCQNDRLEFTAPLEKTYEYAGFFLNTMGGRSYLFRRDSRSRLLVNYYSVLIVASANEKGLNRHGINLSLLIPQLIQEIESTSQLIYKENYLDQLYTLMEKYQ